MTCGPSWEFIFMVLESAWNGACIKDEETYRYATHSVLSIYTFFSIYIVVYHLCMFDYFSFHNIHISLMYVGSILYMKRSFTMYIECTLDSKYVCLKVWLPGTWNEWNNFDKFIWIRYVQCLHLLIWLWCYAIQMPNYSFQ